MYNGMTMLFVFLLYFCSFYVVCILCVFLSARRIEVCASRRRGGCAVCSLQLTPLSLSVLMNLLCPFGFGFDGTLKHAFKGAHVAKRDTMTPLNAVWELEYHTFLWFLTQVKVTETVYSCISCVKMADVKGLAECSFNVLKWLM